VVSPRARVANVKARVVSPRARVANAKARVASAKTKMVTPGPGVPNREPSREKRQTGATTQKTARTLEMTGVLSAHGQRINRPTDRTIKKTRRVPKANAVETATAKREKGLEADTVKIAVAVGSIQTTNNPSQGPSGTVCQWRTRRRAWTTAHRNHPRPQQPIMRT
jgi:hypothetical protein